MCGKPWILLALGVGIMAAERPATSVNPAALSSASAEQPAATTQFSPASRPVTIPPAVERRMEYLRPAEFRELRDQAPIAYLAWGSHEWHGPHLPLGTDTVKAHWLCRELADRTGGIVYPAVYFGYGVMTNPGKDFSLGFPKEIVQQIARHYFLKLYEKGFCVVVVVMGHYGKAHTVAMEEVVKQVEEELQGRLVIVAQPDYMWTRPEYKGDHAAANETSYMELFEPRTVDMSRLPTLAEAESIYSLGVQGPDPRTEASAQRGREQLDLLLSRAVPQIQAALEKANKIAAARPAETRPAATRPVTTQPSESRLGPPFPRIANCYGAGLGPQTPREELNRLARYDLLIGGTSCDWGKPEQVAAFKENVAYLRKINPHIIVLEFSSSAPYLAKWETQEGFPPDGWLLMPDGQSINGWPGSKMINLSHADVVAWQVRRSRDGIVARGHHGTFIDCMAPEFDWWACEIATGKDYQIDADRDGRPDAKPMLNKVWRDAKLAMARQVREAIGPDGIFMGNQAGRETFDVINGILLEDYLDYVLDAKRSWRSVLDDYLYWTGTPHRPNITTIVSSSGVEPPFDAWQSLSKTEQDKLLDSGRKLEQRMRFGLTTTLMGDGYFAYDMHTRWRGQRWWYPEYDAPLGYPRAAAREYPDGTWRRPFDGGLVVVNPTARAATVDTDAPSRDVGTGQTGRAFVIPPSDGRLLLTAATKARDVGSATSGTAASPTPERGPLPAP